MILGPALTGGVVTGHYVATLLDPKKGSLTNRSQAAVEHFKNDAKFILTTALPTAGVVGLAVYKPKYVKKIAKFIGENGAKAISKLGTVLSKFKYSPVKKAATFIKDIAKVAAKHPLKAGLLGLIAAGAIYVVSGIAKFNEKKGRIDQKYEDAAKIESQTKNVVLVEDKKAPKAPEKAYVM